MQNVSSGIPCPNRNMVTLFILACAPSDSSIVSCFSTWTWSSPMLYGNEFSRLTCLSVRRNFDGKSSIFIWTIAVGPSELNKCSQQDAHAAILACDQSRVLKVCWQSTASFCPIGSPIKSEMQSQVAELSILVPTPSFHINALGSTEQQ